MSGVWTATILTRQPGPVRASYTAEYKERILAEYDALAIGSTERGAILGWGGLYSYRLAEWRKARDAAGRGR